MLKRLISLWMLSFSVVAGAATTEARIGNSVINAPVGPDAVVMKDAAGSDALVVFYRLEGKDQVGFVISKEAAPDSGALKWEDEHYVLKNTVMVADGNPPTPVLLGDRLYLFGRDRTHGDGRHIIYNSFVNLEDLITHTRSGAGNREFKNVHVGMDPNPLPIRGHEELAYFAAAPVDNSIVFTYYERNKKKSSLPFSSARCVERWVGELMCEPVTTPDVNTKSMMAIAPISVNGAMETVMVMAGENRHLSLSKFDPAQNAWESLYTSSGHTLANKSIGAFTINGMLQVYFSDPHYNVERMLKKFAWVSEVLDDKAYWVKDSDVTSQFEVKAAIKPIVFKDRAYVLFSKLDPERVCDRSKSCNRVSGPRLWYFVDSQ